MRTTSCWARPRTTSGSSISIAARCARRAGGRDANLVRLRRSLQKITGGLGERALLRGRLAGAARQLSFHGDRAAAAAGLQNGWPGSLACALLYTLLLLLALPFASLVVLWRGLRERELLARLARALRARRAARRRRRAACGCTRSRSARCRRPRAWWRRCAARMAGTADWRSRAQRRHGRARARAAFACRHRGALRALRSAVVPARGAARACGPALLVIMETELWPNLLHACSRAGSAGADRERAPVGAQRSALVALSRRCCSRRCAANVTVAAQSAHDARALRIARRAGRARARLRQHQV